MPTVKGTDLIRNKAGRFALLGNFVASQGADMVADQRMIAMLRKTVSALVLISRERSEDFDENAYQAFREFSKDEVLSGGKTIEEAGHQIAVFNWLNENFIESSDELRAGDTVFMVDATNRAGNVIISDEGGVLRGTSTTDKSVVLDMKKLEDGSYSISQDGQDGVAAFFVLNDSAIESEPQNELSA